MSCGFSRGSDFSVPCKETTLGCNGRCWQHCVFGLAQHTRQIALWAEGRYSRQAIDKEFEKLMNEWIDHAVANHGLEDNRPSKSHKGNGVYQGVFAFTLTKSPDDDMTEEDMIKAARKVMNQQSCPVYKYAWYLEYGDEENKTHPHIHGLYETKNGNRIEAKHFKRAWKIWDEKTRLGAGFRGGYHRPVRAEEAYKDYIKKSNGKNEYSENISIE